MPHLVAGLLLPEMLSKGPLNPATIDADPVWADAVRWGTMARCLSAMWSRARPSSSSEVSTSNGSKVA